MDDQQCYEWAEIFNSSWEKLVNRMSKRAADMGCTQKVQLTKLIWIKAQKENCRWVFIDDPSNVQEIRDIYNNDENINSPACFIVVKQPDPSDERGDVIFDIFRMNAQSYLWHFYRVYTPPK